MLSIAKDDLWTTIKRKDLPCLAQLAADVQARDVDRVYFTPPDYPEYLTTGEIKQIRQTVRHVFDGGAAVRWRRWRQRRRAEQPKPCPDR